MVTGRRPFSGDLGLAVLAKILNDDPDATEPARAGDPARLEKTILRCLRKDPARRYQTMADLKVALEDLADDRSRARRALATARYATRRWAWAALLPCSCWRRVLRLAAVARTGADGAASRRPTHHPARREALSLVFPRRQPRGIYVDRPQQDNPDIYVQTDRRRLSFAADDRPGQRLQPGLVARRPLDRLPAESIGSASQE